MQEKTVKQLSPFVGGAVFSLNVIIYLILWLISYGIISASAISGTDGAAYIQLLISPMAITVTSAVFFYFTRQPVKKLLPLRAKPKYYLMGVLLIFGLLFSLSSLNDLLVKLFELIGYKRQAPFIPDVSGWNIVPAILVVCVIPAVAEEVLFRGLILNCSEEEAGSLSTILCVGLCFSLYHGSVEQTVYQFICGCLFAFLAVRSRSVAPSVLIHFLNNAVIIILCACGCTDMQTGELIMPLAAQITLTVLSALSLVGAVIWLILDKTELKKAQQGGVKKFFIGASVGIAAMVIIWITNLIGSIIA